MNKENTLLEKRAEVKQFINNGIPKTFPAYFYNLVGNVLKKILHLKEVPHWTINAFTLLMATLLPGITTSIVLGEIPNWGESQLFYLSLLPFGFLSSVVCYVNVVYNLLPSIRDHIVDSILSVEDLEKLKKWLAGFWSVRRWLSFTVLIGVLMPTISAIGISQGIGKFIGVGITIVNYLVGPFFMGSLYIIFCVLTFPPQLANYQLKTYDLDPANSEVIQRLISTLNVYLYLVAGYVAIGTVLASLRSATYWWAWSSIIVGWIPTILQFIVNQYSVHKVIVNAKWRVLNQLQEQIIDLRENGSGSAPQTTIKQMNELMDLHDRVNAKPNSALNWGTGLSFLNQLMLPLLGLLLGNMDKLLKLLARTP